MYEKYEVSPTVLEAERRLQEASRELDDAEKEAEEARKKVDIKKSAVSAIQREITKEQKAFMPYQCFRDDLKEYTDRMTRKWNEGLGDKPVFLIRGRTDLGDARNGYKYYPAFTGSWSGDAYYRNVWYWSYQGNKSSYLSKDDPNYDSFEKLLEASNVVIKTDVRIYQAEGEMELNRGVALAFVFYYRDSENFEIALAKTKELIEEQSPIGEEKMIELLYKKYFEH